jgi:hypothetical protein
MKFASLRYGIATLILLLSVSCSSEESKTSDDTTGSLLPGPSELSGYVRTDAPLSYNRDKAWDHLGDNTDKILYNGFQHAATATYASSDKTRRLTLEIMQFNDPVRAFAIFAFLRQPGARPAELQPLGYINRDTLVFVKGVHVGRVIGSNPSVESDLMLAARAMLGKLSDSVLLPTELQSLPREGLIPNTEAASLDDIEGPTSRSNRVSAKYLLGADTVQLFLQLDSSPTAGPSEVVKEFIGNKGQIKDFLLDCEYQALTGQDEQGQFVLCALDKNVMCTVIGKIDQKTAQDLVNKTFALAAKPLQK